jgi:hypothetical protein
MKKLIIGSLIAFVGGFLVPQMALSQSSVAYLSNLGQPPIGSAAVGNDAWLAEEFRTGSNPGGYALDSIQLSMATASGEPNDFTVMIYSLGPSPLAGLPGTSIGTLNGSSDPLIAGTYT